jgi:hypothetical protein
MRAAQLCLRLEEPLQASRCERQLHVRFENHVPIWYIEHLSTSIPPQSVGVKHGENRGRGLEQATGET